MSNFRTFLTDDDGSDLKFLISHSNKLSSESDPSLRDINKTEWFPVQNFVLNYDHAESMKLNQIRDQLYAINSTLKPFGINIYLSFVKNI